MMDELKMELKPIGWIKNPVTDKPADGFNWRQIMSEIVIDPSLAEGLDGLADFSHIMVYLVDA